LAACVWAQPVRLVEVARGLSRPVDIQQPDDGSGRLFVVQQTGIIRVIENGQLLAQPFLDITDRVSQAADERGLLGLAFPRGYASKRYFYVNYVTRGNPGTTTVSRFRVTGLEANRADAGSEEVLLTQPQPFSNHNGGQLQFGPDGYLYIGLGDGGSGGDPQRHAQNPQSLLGKMLRIDVESGPGQYVVPASNPFVNDARFRPEIWAYGLRNPWRYSFDRETGDLWIADVGQNRAEEINLQPASSAGGENYGWHFMEGFSCFVANCTPVGVPPVFEYTRQAGDVSVTGGYVYRGARWAPLRGLYFFGDFASGRIWTLRRTGTAWTREEVGRLPPNSVSTFGEDREGELYVADLGRGIVYRIEGSDAPRFTAAGVVNAASFAPGLVAGSLATVFASGVRDGAGVTEAGALPLPLSIGGVSVLINGAAVPLLAVANVGGQEQINFQVPFGVAGAAARMRIRRGGVESAEAEVPVLAHQPGIYAREGRAILVRNSDNTLVTAERPAEAGGLYYFYASGLGEVENAPAAGAGGPTSPLARTRTAAAVTVGGVPCEVLYAGLAPGLAGVYQVNIRLAASIPAGDAAMVVRIGGVASPSVPVAVR
jgi:uncharacterized protein (TIGR03437 family)